MNRTAPLLAAAMLCVAAAPPPKTTPAKPAAAKPAAPKPAAQKPGQKPAPQKPAGPFDATNPQGLSGILDDAGAKTQIARKDGDAVFVTVTSTAANFSMQFAGCDAQGRACKAVLLDGGLERSAATIAQMNAFNQTSVMCRVYQDKGGVPHVVYSAILFRSMSSADATTHLQAWQGCLADARDFLRDPVGYLANAA